MEIPYEINYDITVAPPQIINNIIDSWTKIEYTEHYAENAEDIIKSRFPGGNYDHIPGMSEVFKTMALNLKVTPLYDWERQGFINNNSN